MCHVDFSQRRSENKISWGPNVSVSPECRQISLSSRPVRFVPFLRVERVGQGKKGRKK